MKETSSLTGKRILLTGATGVLGRELALQLAGDGAELVLLARRKARLEDLDDAIASQDLNSPLLVELDFLRAQEGHYLELAQALAGDGLDALVLAHGLHTGLHPLEHLPAQDWRRILDVNLTGSFLLLRALLPVLKQQRGQIIGVSDAPGRETKAFWGAYAVSKAGFDALLNICSEETEGQVRVDRFEPRAMPSPIRGAVYPGESRDQLPPIADTAAQLASLLRAQNVRSAGDF